MLETENSQISNENETTLVNSNNESNSSNNNNESKKEEEGIGESSSSNNSSTSSTSGAVVDAATAAAPAAAPTTTVETNKDGTPSLSSSSPKQQQEHKGENGETITTATATIDYEKDEEAGTVKKEEDGDGDGTDKAMANGARDNSTDSNSDNDRKSLDQGEGTESMDVDNETDAEGQGRETMDVNNEEETTVKKEENTEDVAMEEAEGDDPYASSSSKIKEEEKEEEEQKEEERKENGLVESKIINENNNENNDNEDSNEPTQDEQKEVKETKAITTTAPPPPQIEQQQQSTPAPATAGEEEKETDGGEAKTVVSFSNNKAVAAAKSNTAAAAAPTPAAAAAAAPSPPPPVLKGTLSYNLETRRHMIRGMWNYENSSAFAPQRFELVRTLDKTEDPTVLPQDGEFHGSFSLAYYHTTSKGKQKERSKVVTEHGVKIAFTRVEGTEKDYKVDGKGTNKFGIFHINGTAVPSQHEGDPVFDIVLRKRYEPSEQPAAGAGGPSASGGAAGGGGGGGGGGKKRKADDGSGPGGGGGDGELPPPSESYPNEIVCLRGQLYKEDAEELGATDVVHRIHGMWSAGLNHILADPQNVNGLCNRFEYEHKSTVPSSDFPVSGKYSGWFMLTNTDGSKSTINERDVYLRFIRNNAGYHNVEGRGFNAFGKYTITGTLSMDNVITIFRHFKPIKLKAKTTSVTSAPPPINKGGQSSRRPSQSAFPEPRMTLDEVEIPGGDSGEPLSPIVPPATTSYSAVSQGSLRLNEDGSHQCNGKWAVTREHFTSGQNSPFNFRLEPHFALEAVNEKKQKDGSKTEESTGATAIPQEFPLDSALYKGSFQLKKKGNRYDTVVDQQVVMKFRKNTNGAYNVYGRGVNAIGVFNLIGTLVLIGKTSGQVELYRMYPPELVHDKKVQTAAVPQVPGKVPSFPKPAAATTSGEVAPVADSSMPKTQLVPSSSTILPGPPRGGLLRRESTRLVKLPSRLEDDDPKAQLARIMEKCVVILRQIREKDIERGAYFSEPVDPVALGIPTYRQVISEPMDLGTVARRLESNQIETPEEFARLVRLVFENAITFNVDPTHSVHMSARFLLIEFNKKFRDIERLLESLRRVHKGPELDEKGKKKKEKEDKKRKRKEEPKSAKRRRLDEAQAMASENAQAMAALAAAAPQGVPNAAVSRGEFNMMMHMMQLLQKQIVQTQNAIAELTPGDETENAGTGTVDVSAPTFDAAATLAKAPAAAAPAPAPERKKQKKKATEPAPKKKKAAEEPPPAPIAVYDDLTKPLTLEEQETLTETINNMPSDHIPGVIQIIRESASFGEDEDEIDLEIDQLDTVTQRKLLRHVSKYIKQPKRTKSKTTKKAKAKAAAAKAAAAPAQAPAPAPKTKKAEKPSAKKPASPKNPGSFFAAFGGKDDSDSSDSDDDDDDEPPKQTASVTPSRGKHLTSSVASKSDDGFELGDGFTGLHDDNDDDLGNGGITANWNISKAIEKNAEKESEGNDDDWGAAQKAAEAEKARQADRKAREQKLEIETELARAQRLEEARKEAEKRKAQLLEEEENEAKKKAEEEKKEKEKIEEARRKMREQVGSVEQTVDLDAQRDIMKQYEQSFLDKELGSASPSSDFGF